TYHPHATLISHISRLLQQPWSVVLQHTLSEGNKGADLLAKYGASESLAKCLGILG
ncbi:hypothetical protein A2U01_0054119, partial [Trifolium medium]|nr:hypothetical protein [Trifolium medium]